MAQVHWLWEKCNAKGDIFTDRYEGYYNVREKTFVVQTEQSNYKDPVSGVPLKKRSEESYFFRMVRDPNMNYNPTRCLTSDCGERAP